MEAHEAGGRSVDYIGSRTEGNIVYDYYRDSAGAFWYQNRAIVNGEIVSMEQYIFGHEVVEGNGRLCNCGRQGCLEAYASAEAVKKRSTGLYETPQSAKEIFEKVREGDAGATHIVEEFLTYLAMGAVNISNILRPEVIVIGGGVSASADLILPRLTEELKKGVYGYEYAPVAVVQAALQNQAGIVGAAYL